MGGDLNLKKSWHPLLMKNQKNVWEEEKKALQERKKIDQVMKERAQERQIEELQRMSEAAGGKKKLNRMDWMYNGPSTGQAGATEEMEGYLLGKRRIDTLIKDQASKKLDQAASEESFMALQHANTVRDTASKVRDDPMLLIKRQEQDALEAMMKDPVQRKALLNAAGKDEEDGKERKHRKRRRHQNGHDDHQRHQRRDERERERDRNRDLDRDRYNRRRRESDENDRHERKKGDSRRRRSFSSSVSRSPSPYRRSRSPPRRRSPSPHHHRRRSSPYRRRSRSPGRLQNNRQDLRHSKSWQEPRRPSPSRGDDRAKKLAAMQDAASELDQDRENRLKAIAEKEATELRAEEAARARSSKYGGKGEFLTGMNRKAGELGVGERMQRGRSRYEKDMD